MERMTSWEHGSVKINGHWLSDIALTEQIKERHDCMNCKHKDFCDFDSYTVLDCMNCVQEGCPCAGCFDSRRWEWRGLPEAPEEGEKEDA